jgi:RNA-directed DNA polymerase
VHDPGKILTDLVMALALGGDCLAGISVLRAQPGLFGPVASDPVVSRLISALAAEGPRALRAIRRARAAARERAWGLAGGRAPGAGGSLIPVDIDATIVKALDGANAAAVINKLNPVIRGWAAYYRTVVSKEIFSSLDHYVWRLTYQWALRAHPNKSKRWAKSRYFDAFHPSRRDHWVFGDRDSGRYLVKFSWTPIARHRLVKGRASMDDPALASYWATRKQRGKPPLGPFYLKLMRAQNGRCPGCGDLLFHTGREPQSPGEWEQWLTTLRKAIRHSAITTPDSQPDENARCLMHTHCARYRTAARAKGPAAPPT